MKTTKQPIQIASIGAIMNTVVMNVYLDHIDMEDRRGPIIWYKEPRGRKIKGQIMDDTLIALNGWDNFEKYIIKRKSDSGFNCTEEHWDGNINLATIGNLDSTTLWNRIYCENKNPNFKRFDLLKINNKVLYTAKEWLEDKDQRESLSKIFDALKEKNKDKDGDTESLYSITAVGKSGVTWYLTEWDPENHIFFGYASLFHDHNDEWGEIPEDDLITTNAVILPHSQNDMRNQYYFYINNK